MPVASLKSSLQTTDSSSLDTTKTLIGMVDKKVRNLEKRKGKLDSYKQLVADGKELNEDQQAAVEHLESVELNLEFAKDLQKQFNQIVAEHAKLQKKQAKKEEATRLANRRNADLAIAKKVLKLQNLLVELSDEARDDFINGTNGAVALGEDVLKQIDELYKVVTPEEEDDNEMTTQINVASQHFVELFNASTKEVFGTTYKSLLGVIDSIYESGYFEKKEEEEEEEEEEKDEEGTGEEEPDESPVEDVVETTTTSAEVENTESGEPANGEAACETEKTDISSQDEVTANEHGLNFLGESEVNARTSQIHADAPPFIPASSQTQSTFDKDFAPDAVDDDSGWGETQQVNTTGFDTIEPALSSEDKDQQRGDRDGFRGGRGGRGAFRGRGGGGGGRGGNSRGNYGGGFGRGGQNQRGGGFRGNRGGRGGNFRGNNRGQRGAGQRGSYTPRD